MSKSRYPDTIYFCDQLMTSTISLKEDYKVERKAMRRLPVSDKDNKYIPPEKQALFMLRYSEKLQVFVDVADKPLEGEFNFIITCEENLKILYSATEHHSYLANGKKVLAAGSLLFNEGFLEIMSNNSGHYRPTDNEMLDAIKALYVLSGEELTSYRSFCSNPVLEYSVEELLTVHTFDSIKPLRTIESLSSSSEENVIIGYDGNMSFHSKNRHRCTLDEDRRLNYLHIIEHGYALFIPSPEIVEECDFSTQIVFSDTMQNQ